MDSPLTGLRVLDFTRLLPGPHCTALLHEMGAEIIKIEDVASGDLTRSMPPLLDGTGALFLELNRGKQSVAVDLKQEDGRHIVEMLAEQSDVIVEGFRPGVAARLGIDFGTLSARNPRLVYCAMSGFGQHGPYRDLPGHDLTYAAMSGFLDALSPHKPLVPGVQLVDAVAALAAAIRILAALRAADHGPRYIDLSMADSTALLMPVALSEARTSPEGEGLGELLQGSPRYDLYECADGKWIAVTPLEEPFWQRFCAVLRREDLLAADEAPTSELLRRVFRLRPAHVWCGLFSEAGVPSGPVRRLRDVLPSQKGSHAPVHGEHTSHWLRELGYANAEIDALASRGVIRRVSAD